MIKITPEAAAQIRKSTEQGNAPDMFLRIAAHRGADGSIEYGMGLDERTEDDQQVTSEGIAVLISNASKDLLAGALLDFVEINPGDYQFIFINPNDPHHGQPAPQDSQA